MEKAAHLTVTTSHIRGERAAAVTIIKRHLNELQKPLSKLIEVL